MASEAMDEPDWAKVLRILYREAPKSPPADITNDHVFVSETDLGADDAKRAVKSLQSWKLVTLEGITSKAMLADKPIADEHHGYQLTNEGFDVAHERELSQRNNRINYSLVFFTSVLVLVQVVDVMPLDDWAKGSAGLAILALMVGVIRWTNLLDE